MKQQFPPAPDVQRDLDIVPTICDVERIMSKAKLRKAVGEDLIGAEVHKSLPALFAEVYNPMFVKSVMWAWWPMQWKGGHVMEVLKSAGKSADVTGYRDVTIADEAAGTWAGTSGSISGP